MTTLEVEPEIGARLATDRIIRPLFGGGLVDLSIIRSYKYVGASVPCSSAS